MSAVPGMSEEQMKQIEETLMPGLHKSLENITKLARKRNLLESGALSSILSEAEGEAGGPPTLANLVKKFQHEASEGPETEAEEEDDG